MKKVITILIGIVALLSLLSLASAAVTLNTPLAGTNWTGTINFNCTKGLDDAPVNVTNVTLWYNTTGGETGTMLASSKINGFPTANNSIHLYLSGISVSSLSNLATYNFSCRAENATSIVWSTGLTGITIDNTAPVMSLSVKPTSAGYGSVIQYKCSSADGLDSSAATTISVTHPTGDSKTSTTLIAGTSDYIGFTDTDYAGTYTFTCTDTDYAGNTGTSTQTVSIGAGASRKASVTKDSTVATQAQASSNNSILIIFIILGIVGYLLFKKK